MMTFRKWIQYSRSWNKALGTAVGWQSSELASGIRRREQAGWNSIRGRMFTVQGLEVCGYWYWRCLGQNHESK